MKSESKNFVILLLIVCSSFIFSYCSRAVSGTVYADFPGQFDCEEDVVSPPTCSQVELVDVKKNDKYMTTSYESNGHGCDTCSFMFDRVSLGKYYLRLVKFDFDYYESKGGEGCKETIEYFKDPSDTSKLLIIDVGFWDFNINNVNYLAN